MEAFKVGSSVLQADEVTSVNSNPLLASNNDILDTAKCKACLKRPAIYRRHVKAVMDLVGRPEVMYQKVDKKSGEPLEWGSWNARGVRRRLMFLFWYSR